MKITLDLTPEVNVEHWKRFNNRMHMGWKDIQENNSIQQSYTPITLVAEMLENIDTVEGKSIGVVSNFEIFQMLRTLKQLGKVNYSSIHFITDNIVLEGKNNITVVDFFNISKLNLDMQFDTVIANPPYAVETGGNVKYLYTSFYKKCVEMTTGQLCFITPTAMVKQIVRGSKGCINYGLNYVNVNNIGGRYFPGIGSTFAYFIVDKNTPDTPIRVESAFGIHTGITPGNVELYLNSTTAEALAFAQQYLTGSRKVSRNTTKGIALQPGNDIVVFDKVHHNERIGVLNCAAFTPKSNRSSFHVTNGQPKMFFNQLSTDSRYVYLDLQGNHYCSGRELMFNISFDNAAQAQAMYDTMNTPQFAEYLRLFKHLTGALLWFWFEKNNLV